MSDLLNQAVEALSNRISAGSFDSTAKFDIAGEGSIIVDSDGVRADDGDADVTLLADADTFQQIFEGSLDSTAAFMSGRLRIEGNMGTAMKLASLLS